MKTIILSFFFSFNLFASANVFTIGNSFQVDQEGYVYRGKEPKKRVTELAEFGITDVIIFKNEVKTEVQEELAALAELGIEGHHIPFRWKQFPSYIEACEQVVEGLNKIHKVKENGGKVFFHCTAGEDRTGMLAGLYRMLEENISQKYVFRKEMCERHYSDGNPNKPVLVTSAIQKDLTPLFLALAAKIESGDWELGKISKRSCKNIQVLSTPLKCRQ